MIIVLENYLGGSTSAIWIAANEEGHVTSLNRYKCVAMNGILYTQTE